MALAGLTEADIEALGAPSIEPEMIEPMYRPVPLTSRAEWSRTMMRPSEFRPGAFHWLRDQTFHRLSREIWHRYRRGEAPPCSRVDISELDGGRELELRVDVMDGWRTRVRLEGARGIDLAFLTHVGYAQICMLFWDGQAADFNRSWRLAFDWRSDIELSNRIDDAARGLEPRRTADEPYYWRGVDPAGPEAALTTYTVQRSDDGVRLENVAPLTATQQRAIEDHIRREYRAALVFGGPRRVEGTWNTFDGAQAFAFADRNAAEARGETLLREWLSAEQLAQYDRDKHFDVIGCHSKRRYRICRARSFNVLLLDAGGEVEEQICFVPAGNLVLGDQMLAQKVALETDENAAMEVANRQWLGPRRGPPGAISRLMNDMLLNPFRM